MLGELAARRAETRCVVVTGSDGMFSAGYEIGEISDGRFQEEAERLVAHPFTEAIEALEAFPYPTLAALPGHTIGGGLELALACDLRVAAERDQARHAARQARSGLLAHRPAPLHRRDRRPRTRELFLLGSYIDADTALGWGLRQPGRRGSELERAALRLAAELAANAPLSQVGNKRVDGRPAARARARCPRTSKRELIELRRARSPRATCARGWPRSPRSARRAGAGSRHCESSGAGLNRTRGTAEALLADRRPQLGVFHAETLALGQAQHADLADVAVELHFAGSLAHLLERNTFDSAGTISAHSDQAIGLPGLLPVGGVTADHRFRRIHRRRLSYSCW